MSKVSKFGRHSFEQNRQSSSKPSGRHLLRHHSQKRNQDNNSPDPRYISEEKGNDLEFDNRIPRDKNPTRQNQEFSKLNHPKSNEYYIEDPEGSTVHRSKRSNKSLEPNAVGSLEDIKSLTRRSRSSRQDKSSQTDIKFSGIKRQQLNEGNTSLQPNPHYSSEYSNYSQPEGLPSWRDREATPQSYNRSAKQAKKSSKPTSHHSSEHTYSEPDSAFPSEDSQLHFPGYEYSRPRDYPWQPPNGSNQTSTLEANDRPLKRGKRPLKPDTYYSSTQDRTFLNLNSRTSKQPYEKPQQDSSRKPRKTLYTSSISSEDSTSLFRQDDDFVLKNKSIKGRLRGVRSSISGRLANNQTPIKFPSVKPPNKFARFSSQTSNMSEIPEKRNPAPAYEPQKADSKLYSRIAQTANVPGQRKLVEKLRIEIRSGKAWKVPKGYVCRLSTPEGPQVGDLNIWNLHNPRERFWAARTRQLQQSHVSTLDRLWSNLPYLRPLVTVTADSLSNYTDDVGGRVHDLLGTRCDPYVDKMFSGDSFDFHCHSNLTRAVLPYGLTEFDIHDVLNVFQVTGLNREGQYFMEPCPAKPGDYFEFFAEIDILCAMSACPGGDLSAWGWGEDTGADMVDCCRPLEVEVYKLVDSEILKDWKSPDPANSLYKGVHGLGFPVFKKEGSSE